MNSMEMSGIFSGVHYEARNITLSDIRFCFNYEELMGEC
jgi:hypothetical protein